MSNNKKNQTTESHAKKAAAERLAIKLRRSIGTLKGVLSLAKKEGIGIPEACRRSGMNHNYANVSFHLLRKAEEKNGVRLDEVVALERLRDRINASKGSITAPATTTKGERKTTAIASAVSGIANTRKKGTGIENAIAGLRHAVENKMSLHDASLAIGKTESFLSMCISSSDKLSGTEEQKNKLLELHAEYKTMVGNNEIRINHGRSSDNDQTKNAPSNIGRKRSIVRTFHRASVTSNKKAPRKTTNKTAIDNAVIGISEATDVEYKYPPVSDRPIRKIQKAYPLEIMEPGHSFSVPATKKEMKLAKKAVTMFARKTGTKFIQAKEGKELVFWRAK